VRTTSSPMPDTVASGSLILLLALLSLLSLTACTINHSADPKLGSILHQCFRTTDDAVLYETPFCPPHSGLSKASTCVTVRYLNSFRPPVTLREFSTSGRAEEAVVSELRRPAEEGQGLFTPAPEKIHILGVLIWANILHRGGHASLHKLHRGRHLDSDGANS
jgi:hypothetical protein